MTSQEVETIMKADKNLYGADLYGANLRGANLRGAKICQILTFILSQLPKK